MPYNMHVLPISANLYLWYVDEVFTYMGSYFVKDFVVVPRENFNCHLFIIKKMCILSLNEIQMTGSPSYEVFLSHSSWIFFCALGWQAIDCCVQASWNNWQPGVLHNLDQVDMALISVSGASVAIWARPSQQHHNMVMRATVVVFTIVLIIAGRRSNELLYRIIFSDLYVCTLLQKSKQMPF